MRWLEEALQDAVPAPHAMTLATADDGGRPSSRVLICKDVDGEGRWYFASGAASGKGRDLAVNPPLDDPAELDRAFGQAQARVAADPGLIAPG